MPEAVMIPPPVTWAQRKNIIFLTFCVEDCKNPTINITSDKVYFKGIGGTEKKTYEVTIELFKEIDNEKSRYFVRDRVIELILTKKEEGPFWPHLLKEKTKMHWLKVDFTKWKDEDDSEDELGNNDDLSSMMRQMGGLGGDMGGLGGERPSFDDFDGGADGSDSDDEDLPDLE